jgi:hypothetical protein
MVNTLKMNLVPSPAGTYGKSMKYSTPLHYQANNSKGGLKAERIQALGGLRSLQSKKKLVAEK